LASYDVVVLGGGPAGSAAALALVQVRPELRVALVEASSFERPRIGETLAPGGRQLLEGLGVWERVRGCALESFATSAVWGSEQRHDNEFLFSARGNAWHVDRTAFDAALVAAAAANGVAVRARTRFTASSRRADGRWELTLVRSSDADVGASGSDASAGASGGHELACDASVVIDATGRTACFASRQGAGRIVDDRLTGLAMRFRAPHAVDPTTLVEAAEDGWWYSAAIPGQRIVAAWMSDADLVRRDGLKHADRWAARMRRSRETAARLAGCTPESEVSVWSARSQRLARVTGERWLAAGDAASAFDPLSSAGILKALYTGKIAAFAVLDLLGGNPCGFERYRAHVEGGYAAYLTTRTWFYNEERRWPNAPFWSRRHAPVPAAATAGAGD
jgi:flavin-dependent dehydrogenase